MRLKSITFLVITLLLISCGSQDKHHVTALTKYEVKPMPMHKSLHFTGTIQPLKENTLTSPMDAVVEAMNFHYGQMVKKGEVVLTLNSTDLQKQYNETLTDYLKAKDSYSIAKAKFVGTKELWAAGLISKNNYLSEKSSIDTSRVTLMQSTRKLTEMLEKMDDTGASNLSELRLADFNKLRKILTSSHNLIRVKAPADGVLLYPPKSTEDKAMRVTIGSSVKPGQVIALIGDLKGVSIEIDVPEIDIDKIHPGMIATISGVAFGNRKLKGQLVAVNAQASNSGSGGLPSFTAVVEVKTLLPEEQAWIKVGMSAAIELTIDSENELLVPIAAVKREQGNSIVQLQLAQGATQKRVITTGSVQADSVVIKSGLKAGDVVVYD